MTNCDYCNPAFYREQENKWLTLAKEPIGRDGNLTAAGLTLAILIQGENLELDQKYAIQNAIDRIDLSLIRPL